MGRFPTAEHGFAILLAAVLSGLLTLAFAIGMVCGLGIHAPFNYSVFGYPQARSCWPVWGGIR
jgi:hypothetical protein